MHWTPGGQTPAPGGSWRESGAPSQAANPAAALGGQAALQSAAAAAHTAAAAAAAAASASYGRASTGAGAAAGAGAGPGGHSAVPPPYQPPADRMVAALDKELKAVRQQLHRAGQYAGLTQALSSALAAVEQQQPAGRGPPLISTDDVFRLMWQRRLPYALEYFERERRVRSAVVSYLAVEGAARTLYDLEEFIVAREKGYVRVGELAELIHSYNDLLLGPLWRHPEAIRAGLAHEEMTGMPTPKVTHADVVQVVWALVRARRQHQELTEEELRLQLERTYQRPCRDLGVVIGRGFGTLIGQLQKAWVEATAMEQAQRDFLVAAAQQEVNRVWEQGRRLLPGLRMALEQDAMALWQLLRELATAEANVLAADPPTHEGGGGATVPPPVDKALQVLQAVTLRMVDTSTHALLLAAHKEAGTGAVRAGGGAGGGMALVQRAAQMLVACAPPRVLEAEQSMAAWQRMGLPLPELMSVVKNTLPPGYTGWWAGSPEVRRALAGEVAAPLYKALQVTAVLVAQLRRSFAAYGVANVAAGAQQDGQGPGQEDENKRQQQKQQEREGEGDGGGGEWARGGAGGRGAAGGPKVATSRQRLREVVAELNQGLSFRSLAALERGVAAALGADSFAQLGRGPSLLAALAEDHQLALELTGGGMGVGGGMGAGAAAGPAAHAVCGAAAGCGGADPDEVLGLVAMVLAAGRAARRQQQQQQPEQAGHGQDTGEDGGQPACAHDPAALEAAETALRRQYRVPCAAALGLGPVRHLAALAVQYDSAVPAAARVVPEYGIATGRALQGGGMGAGWWLGCEGVQRVAAAAATKAGGAEKAVGADAGAAAAGSATASVGWAESLEGAAAVCLNSALMLVDLAEWSCWEEAFEGALGPLKTFVARMTPTVGQPASSGRSDGANGISRSSWRAVEAPGGRLYKIPAGLGAQGSTAAFTSALSRLDGPSMAAALASLVADCGGADAAPLQYLAGVVEGSWAALADGGAAAAAAVHRAAAARSGRGAPVPAHMLPLLRCCLDCLAAIPVKTLRLVAAERVLLPPLESPQVVGRGWRAALLAAARPNPAHRSALHQLGLSLGYEEWCADWARQRVAPPPPPPATAAAAAGCTPAAIVGSGSAAPLPAVNADFQERTAAGTAAIVACGGVDKGANVSAPAEAGVAVAEAAAPLGAVSDRDTTTTTSAAAAAAVVDRALTRHGANVLDVATPAGADQPHQGRGTKAEVQGCGGFAGGSIGGLGEGPAGAHESDAVAGAADCMAARRRECAAVVDRIRHTYGVDKQYTDPDAIETIRCNTERVGNAVVQLSDQLYSKDLHFVMELLQNAEDNSYPLGVVPCLEFVLTRDALVVLNNETGFQEGDVRALSDINRSTKRKKRGYIGKKGIGFKSVFKVSDAPEVHSNGFHVAFSRTMYGNLGMVLPTNVPPYDGSQLPSQLGLTPAPTVIRLPLKGAGGAGGGREAYGADGAEAEDAAAAAVAAMRTALREVDPWLLLFLKKLKRIAVTDATSPEAAAAAAVAAASSNGDARVMEAAGRRDGAVPDDNDSHGVYDDEDTAEGGGGPGCGLSLQVQRRDLGGGRVGLSYGPPGAQRHRSWLIVSDCFPPEVDRGDLTIAELGETEVSLAFDLEQAAEVAAAAAAAAAASAAGGSGGGGNMYKRPRREQVFAYLPTREYGLRFMVNADFIVTTSREALDSGSPWNKMLAARIPQLFIRSLGQLRSLWPSAPIQDYNAGECQQQRQQQQQKEQQQQDPGGPGSGGGRCSSTAAVPPLPYTPHAALNFWLSCVPLPEEAQDPFCPLPAAIGHLARAHVRLPTACGQLLCPAAHQLRVCHDPRVRELLADTAVQAALRSAGVYFVSEAVAPLHASPQLRALLGVLDFRVQDMVGMLDVLLSGQQANTLAPAAPVSAVAESASGAANGGATEQGSQGPYWKTGGHLPLGLLARMLLVIFSALGVRPGATHANTRLGPGGNSTSSRSAASGGATGVGQAGRWGQYGGHGAGAGTAADPHQVHKVWAALRSLRLLPVLGGQGGWVAPAGGGVGGQGSSAAPVSVFLLPGSEAEEESAGLRTDEQQQQPAAGGRRVDAGKGSSADSSDLDGVLRAVGLPPDLSQLLQPLQQLQAAVGGGGGGGGAAAAPAASVGAPALLFLDPALPRELPPGEQRELLLAGLRELGVRPLEAPDVMDLAVLSLLRGLSAAAAAAAAAAQQGSAPTPPPPLAPDTLVACLAFPLAAGLVSPPPPAQTPSGARARNLDTSIGSSSSSSRCDDPHATTCASPASLAPGLLGQLQRCAWVVLCDGSMAPAPTNVVAPATARLQPPQASAPPQHVIGASSRSGIGTGSGSSSSSSSRQAAELLLPAALCPHQGLDFSKAFPQWDAVRHAVLSQLYVTSCTAAVPPGSWAWLLRCLGATPFPRLRHRTVLLWPQASEAFAAATAAANVADATAAAAAAAAAGGAALAGSSTGPRTHNTMAGSGSGSANTGTSTSGTPIAMLLADSPWAEGCSAGGTETEGGGKSGNKEEEEEVEERGEPVRVLLPPCPPGHVYRLYDTYCPGLDELLDAVLGTSSTGSGNGGGGALSSGSGPAQQACIGEEQGRQLVEVAKTLQGLWETEGYGSGLRLRGPVEVVREEEAVKELQAAAAEATGRAAAAGVGDHAGAGRSVRRPAAGEEAAEAGGSRSTQQLLPASTFVLQLKRRRWLPTCLGVAARASECVPRLPQLVELFGDAPLPYLLGCPGPGLAPEGPLLSALGLPCRATHTLLLQQLRRLAYTQTSGSSAQPGALTAAPAAAAAASSAASSSSSTAGGAACAPTVVRLDPGRMCALYSHLEREAHVSGHGAAVEVCRAFAEHPLIWVPDALVAGGPGDSSSALTPKSRFGLATSSGSTFPAQSQRGAPTAAASFPSSSRPGRFLRHTEVVLHDPTGVLEQLWQCSSRQGGSSSSRDTGHAGTAKAKEAPGVASLPRVLEAHYPAKVMSFFEELCEVSPARLAPRMPQTTTPTPPGACPASRRRPEPVAWELRPHQPLLPRQPTLDQYAAALRQVAASEARPSPRALLWVRAILQPWADAAAAGRLPSDGPMGRRLRALLAGAAVLPTLVGGWASAAGGLLLNDRPDLARHFGQQQGVHILDVTFSDTAAAAAVAAPFAARCTPTAAAGAPTAQPSGPAPLEPLLSMLGAKPLSYYVKESTSYEGLKTGWAVDRLLRVSLTFVQRYLLHRQPGLYGSVRHHVAARLPRLQIFVVDKGTLKVVHELHLPGRDTPLLSPPEGRPAVLQLRQPPRAAAAAAAGGGGGGGSTDGAAASAPPAPDPWLYVDDVKGYKAMVTELSRLFSPTFAPLQDLSLFLLNLIHSHEQDPDPDKDTNREAAEACAAEDGCGPLPEGEPMWEVSLGQLLPGQGPGGAARARGDPSEAAPQPQVQLPDVDLDELLAGVARPPPKARAEGQQQQQQQPGGGSWDGGGLSFGGLWTQTTAGGGGGGGGGGTPRGGGGGGGGGGDDPDSAAYVGYASGGCAGGAGGGEGAASGVGMKRVRLEVVEPGQQQQRQLRQRQQDAGGRLLLGDFHHREDASVSPAAAAAAPVEQQGGRGSGGGGGGITAGRGGRVGLASMCAFGELLMRPARTGAAPAPAPGPAQHGSGGAVGQAAAAGGGGSNAAVGGAPGRGFTPRLPSDGDVYGGPYDHEPQYGTEGAARLEWVPVPALLPSEAVSHHLQTVMAAAAAAAAPSGQEQEHQPPAGANTRDQDRDVADGGDGGAEGRALGRGVGGTAAARWAEAVVYELLRRDPGVAAGGWEVTWVSAQEGMRYAPYDILLTRGGPGTCPPERVYVEVKSSSSSDKSAFEMSVQEVELARAEGHRYVVFRLLGTRHVSAAQLRLQVLVDPWAMCARRELQLCVVAG